MPRIWLGVLCGFIFGALAAAFMIPMQFTDKRAAITGAFINRFSIGDALITKAYAPIVGLGAIGGLIIGLIVSRFGR